MKRIIHILACGFGTGYAPLIPGTVGTLVGVGAVALLSGLSWWQYGIVTVVFSFLAVWIADQAIPAFNSSDPKQIVIDEIAGYLVTMFGHPLTCGSAIASFVLFRIFDVLKPPPCRRLERLRGGLGIVVDDLVAGVYANLILTLSIYIYGVLR